MRAERRWLLGGRQQQNTAINGRARSEKEVRERGHESGGVSLSSNYIIELVAEIEIPKQRGSAVDQGDSGILTNKSG